MSVTLLYLAHNRLEFTQASIKALLANTDWDLVQRVLVYDDSSMDGTTQFLASVFSEFYLGVEMSSRKWGSPVAIMCDAIERIGKDTILAKIDNDTMVPPGWLNECLDVMNQHPSLDLLGLESMYPIQAKAQRSIEDAEFIGGIGLMRTRAFETLPEADGRFGFTSWQEKNPQVKKAWLNPSLPVCLLDRVPVEPWRYFSAGYVAYGWQRPWEPYTEDKSALWEWFT